jgi:hemolysin III
VVSGTRPSADRERSVIPRFRGRLHQAAFFAAVPAGIVLVAVAHTATGRLAAAVYAAGLVGLFGVSAAYHRLRWSPRSRATMKRADHSMIYVFIAATTTPVSLALPAPWSIMLVCTVWAGAVAGVALKLIRIDGFALATAFLYLALGWLSLAFAPELLHRVGVAPVVLIVLGGLLFTAGAIVFRGRRPDPAPATFGYHEVWHAFVVGAATCHFVAVLLIVMPARVLLG